MRTARGSIYVAKHFAATDVTMESLS